MDFVEIKKEFNWAMFNEPSVFELLKMDCITRGNIRLDNLLTRLRSQVRLTEIIYIVSQLLIISQQRLSEDTKEIQQSPKEDEIRPMT